MAPRNTSHMYEKLDDQEKVAMVALEYPMEYIAAWFREMGIKPDPRAIVDGAIFVAQRSAALKAGSRVKKSDG